MNKLILILPLFLLSMCSDAPVTPPAGASELPPNPATVPSPYIKPKGETTIPSPYLPRKELKGEVDIWNVNQIHQMQMMFLHNARQANIENNMTQPSDAINNALEQFWEVQDGSDGSTEQEKLL
jgi:hypothetical protein